MTTKIETAKSIRKNVEKATSDVCDEVKSKLTEKPSLLILYATTQYDQQKLLNGVRQSFPGVPLTGCSVEGVISREGSDETNHIVMLTAIYSDDIKLTTVFTPSLGEDYASGVSSIVSTIKETTSDDTAAFLFPDGVGINATALIREIDKQVSTPINIFGGMAGDSMQFQQSYQYNNDTVTSGGVSGFLVSGAKIEYIVSHGCSPIGTTATVTEADANVIKKIDGESAVSAISKYYDTDDPFESLMQGGVGAKIGDKGDENDFIMRAPLKIDNDHGWMQLTAEIKQGDTVRFHHRNPEEVSKRSVTAFKEAAEKNSVKPLFVMHFDCASRGKALFNEEVTESLVDPLVGCFDDSLPWFGFHSYGEFAPLHGVNEYHNYSAVLTLFYPK